MMNTYRTLALAALLAVGAIVATAGEWAGNVRSESTANSALGFEHRASKSAGSALPLSQDRYLFGVPQGAKGHDAPVQPWDDR